MLCRRERQERVHVRELDCGQHARVYRSERDLHRRGRGTVRRRANRPAWSSQRGRQCLSRGVASLLVNTTRIVGCGARLTSQASSTVVSASIAMTGESIRSAAVSLRVLEKPGCGRTPGHDLTPSLDPLLCIYIRRGGERKGRIAPAAGARDGHALSEGHVGVREM